MNKRKDFFRNYKVELIIFKRRRLFSILFIIFLTGILFINLFRLQIIHFKFYQNKSIQNCIKSIPIPPVRGTIYDSNGIPLAINQTIYCLEITPKKVVNLNKTLFTLKKMLDLTENDILSFKKKIKNSHFFTSLPLKKNLTEIQQAKFLVNQYLFPGVEIKAYQKRYYPYGSILTHVIGYISKIDNKEIEKLKKENKFSNYIANKEIGKLGVEKFYEDILHGKTGYKKVEVNSKGEIIRKIYEEPPHAGKDIVLTIDVHLQNYINRLLKGSRSAVVVTDPTYGGILALVSNPSYDPNLFINGLSKKIYKNLLEDTNLPLINRTTQGIYPPASTIKPYISISALELGIINSKLSIFDPGWWKIPGSKKKYRDWKKSGHGYLNLIKAIEESSDTFFYQLAYEMGIDILFNWMTKFGYGQYTGIDLFEENSALMPNRNWKKIFLNKPWYQGDTIPIGIGQGYWTATPIQMSKSLMTLINNGIIYVPHLLKYVKEKDKLLFYYRNTPKVIGNFNQKYWSIAKNGMYGVANFPNGTAYNSFFDTPYKVAAKSGTAQVFNIKNHESYDANKISENLRDHKLMIAFAPFDNPKIAVVVVLENGGNTNYTAGKITRKILDYVLLKEKKENSFISLSE